MGSVEARPAREAVDGNTARSWHPLLVSSRWRLSGPTGRSINRQSAGDEGQRNSAPGRTRHKPLKPLRRESRGVPAHLRSAVCVLAHDCGCHGHPAFPDFPCALFFLRASSMHNFGRTRAARSQCVSSGGRIQRKQPCVCQHRHKAAPPAPVLRRRTAFRGTRGLIICCHFIMGFYWRCAGLLRGAANIRRWCS